MKILVTGATGFIGSHLVDNLLELGYDVRATIRKTSNLQWLEGKKVELIEANLNSIDDTIKAVKDVDYVYHVAGLVAAQNYQDFLKANRDATETLLKACEQVNPNLQRFVLVSSQTVSGPSSSLDNPQTEDDIPKPITNYGRSKLEGERVTLNFIEKLPVTIVRPPAVYGPRDTAIKDIFKLANKGIAPLIGFDDKFVSLIYIQDLVKGIILAGESNISEGQIYFITSNQFYCWNEIMDSMKTALNKQRFFKLRIPNTLVLGAAAISEFLGRFSDKPPVFDYEKGIDFIQKYWICSPEKARRDLDFVSEVSLDDGLTETAEWYKYMKWI